MPDIDKDCDYCGVKLQRPPDCYPTKLNDKVWCGWCNEGEDDFMLIVDEKYPPLPESDWSENFDPFGNWIHRRRRTKEDLFFPIGPQYVVKYIAKSPYGTANQTLKKAQDDKARMLNSNGSRREVWIEADGVRIEDA